MKIKSIKKRVDAKVVKAKTKVARKCGKVIKTVKAIVAIALLMATMLSGCMGTTTPSRSQNMTISDCTINVYGCGTETNEVPRVELITQAMSIENSGTETQTSSPTQTTDVKPNIDARYNDAIAGASAASKGVLETLTSAGVNAVLELMSSKKTGSVEVTKADGSSATVECKDGQCSFCTDCAP